MKAYAVLLALLFTTSAACGQPTDPGFYNCEGCEAIFEHSFEGLTWDVTIADADEPGEPLVLTGTVYRPDGKTPAPGVIVYAYHTDAEGRYPMRGGETGWARRHGYLRAWVQTDAEGRYRFTTIRPNAYPNRQDPAHVHMVIKEPERREYWIDDVMFEDDPLITEKYRTPRADRGGLGIITLERDEKGVWRGVRDIVLAK